MNTDPETTQDPASNTRPTADLCEITAHPNYVAGFLFGSDYQTVALIRKKRPRWQKGKLNGIGGSIEQGETSLQAMVREFREETGVETTPESWHAYATITKMEHGRLAWKVDFFAGTAPGTLKHLQSATDETVEILLVMDLYERRMECVENLSWLIPRAMEQTRYPHVRAYVHEVIHFD